MYGKTVYRGGRRNYVAANVNLQNSLHTPLAGCIFQESIRSRRALVAPANRSLTNPEPDRRSRACGTWRKNRLPALPRGTVLLLALTEWLRNMRRRHCLGHERFSQFFFIEYASLNSPYAPDVRAAPALLTGKARDANRPGLIRLHYCTCRIARGLSTFP